MSQPLLGAGMETKEKIMKSAMPIALLLVGICTGGNAVAAPAPIATGSAQAVAAAAPMEKNWQAPAYKTLGQSLVDKLMSENPGLLSVTFHGLVPGSENTYSMFAGSFPDRVGKVSADDDIMVIKSGFTIIDPRYKKNDPERKFLVLVPLRDAGNQNVGCIVFAFKNPANSGGTEASYLSQANALRDGIQAGIPGHAELFGRAP